MAGDLLRGPSYCQDAYATSYCTPPRRHSAFHFGYGVDVIEENALNEKYCLQVLRILITKADADIEELEKDLVSLQSELAFAENEGWLNRCCNVLKEKIDCLDVSLRSLRDRDEHHIDVHLLMHREPAERIHDIVNALLRNHCQERDEGLRRNHCQGKTEAVLRNHCQRKDVQYLLKSSSSDASEYAVDLLEENKNPSNFDPKFALKEEATEAIISPIENHKFLSLSLQLQEKQPNSLETFKDCSLDSLKLVAGHSDKKKPSSQLDSENARKGECKDHKFTHEDDSLVRSLSLEITEKSRHNVEVVKPVDTVIKNFSTDALKHVIRNSSEKKILSDSGSSCMSEEVERDAAVDVIKLHSALVLNEKKTDPVRKVKPENSISNDTASAALGCRTAHLSKKKKPCKPNVRVNVNEKVREHHFTATDRSKKFNVSWTRKLKGNLDRTVKPVNSIVKDISPDDLRHTTSLDQKQNGSHSTLVILRRANSDNSIGEETKLNNVHALKTAQMKETKVVQTEEIGSSISSSNTEEKRKCPLKMLTDQETGITDTGHSALTSLLELQDQREEDGVKPQTEGKPLVEVQKSKTSPSDKKPNLNMHVKKQRQKTKNKIQSNPRSIQVAGSTPVELVLGLSSISKAKRQKAVEIYNENVSLNKLLRKKPDQKKAKEHTFTVNCRKNKALQSKMKSKKSSNSSLIEGSVHVHTDISDTYHHITDSKREENMLTSSSAQPSLPEAREPVSSGDASKSSVLPKKRKINSSLPVILEIKDSTFHIPNGYEETTGGTKKEDMLVTESCPMDGSCASAAPGVPLTSVPKSLNDLTLIELKAIAKQQNMTRYHKLRKEALIAQLANTLGSCQIYM